ncbi:MAG: recombinase family protein [Rhizobiaceae bacterium]|nr:recombinase family protein [Rhizobiaceae bacterium]
MSRSPSSAPRLRCAVYTRKSSEEGLEQDFNSLDAQFEACAAFIASQAGLGWKLVSDRYDDGGISGGTMERPALRRLLQDVRDRKIDVVVVYKIDRLTRSLMDFARIVEVFDQAGASFVSVTQQFNTTTSMGRLTLNVLLSFAQFEREVTAERIRDKIAASKRKGMWMGGAVPLGYRVRDRRLIIHEKEAGFVRHLFRRYLELGSVPRLVAELNRAAVLHGKSCELKERDAQDENPADKQAGARGTPKGVHDDDLSRNGRHRSAGGTIAAATTDIDGASNEEGSAAGSSDRLCRPMRAGMLYKVLANPLYIGKLRHHDNVYDGEHEANIDEELFGRVQQKLAAGAATPRGSRVHGDIHLLTGILFDETGDRLAPTHARAHGRRYRYYVSSRIRTSQGDVAGSWRVPATQIEQLVIDAAVGILRDRARIARWIGEHVSAHLIKPGLDRVEAVIGCLSSAQPAEGRRTALHRIFSSITLSATSIRFEVVPGAIVGTLLERDEEPAGMHETPDVTLDDDSADPDDALPATEIIDVPVILKRRGSEMRLVIDSPLARPRQADPALVDLVARAHVYLDRLTSSSDIGSTEIAREFGVDRADVGRILPLAFLSPAMLAAILTGRQSPSLTARQLARIDLPLLWSGQEAALRQ